MIQDTERRLLTDCTELAATISLACDDCYLMSKDSEIIVDLDASWSKGFNSVASYIDTELLLNM
eukprot:1363488-Pyramimonas_sp.AAC.1